MYRQGFSLKNFEYVITLEERVPSLKLKKKSVHIMKQNTVSHWDDFNVLYNSTFESYDIMLKNEYLGHF